MRRSPEISASDKMCRTMPGGLPSLGHDGFRIVSGKKRRHVELAGLQIISPTTAVHDAGLHGLSALDVGISPQRDHKVAVRRPIDAERAIVLVQPVLPKRVVVIL